MKRNTGLALLALASIYQVSKMRKRSSEQARASQVIREAREEGRRKSPVQRLKDAQLKKKGELSGQSDLNVDIPVEVEIDSGVDNTTEEITEHEEQSNTEAVSVYIVGKGKKYHLSKDCRGIKKDSELTKMSLEDAHDKGYSLCGWEV